MRKLNIFVTALLGIRNSKIILQQNICKDQLDFVGSKEAPWASVLAVSEMKRARGNRDKLVTISVLSTRLAHIVESVTIEFLGLRIEFWIERNGVGGDFNGYSGGEICAVRKRNATAHFTAE